MRIRTIHAADMAEGMRKLRRELGPNAIIIANQASRSGVRITAAIEPEPSPAERPSGGEERHTIEPPAMNGAMNGATPLHAVIAHHRPPERLAARLTRALSAFRNGAPEDTLADALETIYQFAPLGGPGPRTLVLIGPPGAGKTVATAKLATKAVLEARKVHVATTDTVKAGGVEQLRAFTDILQLPLGRIDSPAALKRYVTRVAAEGGDALTIIDTPGVNPFNAAELADMRRYVDAAAGAVALVLPAGGDAEEAAEHARAFGRLGARQLIASRVDMARRLGGLLAAAEAGALALAEVSLSPYVSDGLIPLNSQVLSRLLNHGANSLSTPSHHEFQSS